MCLTPPRSPGSQPATLMRCGPFIENTAVWFTPWRTSRSPIGGWPRRQPNRPSFRPGGRRGPSTRPVSWDPGWRRSPAGQPSISIAGSRAAAHESLDAAAPTDPALVSLPPSIERVYDIWEVRQALAQLTPEDAALVRLHHLDGLSQAEIAERLGIPLGTVKSRTYRVHRRLAAMLGHLRDDPERTEDAEPA